MKAGKEAVKKKSVALPLGVAGVAIIGDAN